MPKGHYDRTLQRLTDADYVLHLLKERPLYWSDLCNRLRRREPDRRIVYALLRRLETSGSITYTTHNGRTLYARGGEGHGHSASAPRVRQTAPGLPRAPEGSAA